MNGALSKQAHPDEDSPTSAVESAREAAQGCGEAQDREQESIRARRTIAALVGLLVCLYAFGAGAETLPCDEEHGWNQRMQDQTMTVWDHAVPNSGLRAVKFGGVVHAPPEAVWAVVMDLNHYSNIFPFQEETRVLGSEDDGRRLFFYAVLAAPFVAKRDYTLDVHIEDVDVAKGHYRLSFSPGNDYAKAPPPVKGSVRVTDVRGFWEVKAWGLGFAHVAYCVRADPGGNLPAFFVNAAQVDAMPKILNALRKAAIEQRPKQAGHDGGG
jgi:hypothetical protein